MRSNHTLWLWIPPPVRNCALGGDDTELVAAALPQLPVAMMLLTWLSV
ncbi:hypothetical protein ABIA45_007046 [Bradyrhizobium sp. USDA 336]